VPVPEVTLNVAGEIERYLRTGGTDASLAAWPDGSFLARAQRAHADLRGALVREVRRLAAGRSHESPPVTDTVALTRSKVEPMVRGLFPRIEHAQVLSTLEKSIVFLTSANIERILVNEGFDHAAWILANLYLASLGAELLGDEAPHLVGVSQETTCYVSPEYFAEADPFADFIVHEAAHIFHNCKRRTVGLPETRTKEWLLDIEYRKRETFAYACEAYSRVLERGRTAAQRRALAAEYSKTAERINDERVEPGEVAGIVVEAANVRNGWKVILARCASVRRRRSCAAPASPVTPAARLR
jgi:hypothetical protein